MLKLKLLHMKLIKQCKYDIAHRLMTFMIDKRIILHLNDTDFALERELNKLKFEPIYISQRSGLAEYKIQ